MTSGATASSRATNVETWADVLGWYSGSTRRKTGRLPASSTLRTKASKFATVSEHLGTPPGDGRALVEALSTREAVEALLDWLCGRMTTGSARCVVDALRTLSQWGEAQGLCSIPIEKDDRPPLNPQKPLTTFTDEEAAALVEGAREDPRFHLFLTILKDCGWRSSEALGLRWADLHLDGAVPYADLQHTKNKRQSWRPLSGNVVRLLLQYSYLQDEDQGSFAHDPSEYVIAFTYNNAHRRLVWLAKRVGVNLQGRNCHAFRHTLASNLLAEGAPLNAVSKLLGHANIQTTAQRYDHTTALTFASYLAD